MLKLCVSIEGLAYPTLHVTLNVIRRTQPNLIAVVHEWLQWLCQNVRYFKPPSSKVVTMIKGTWVYRMTK